MTTDAQAIRHLWTHKTQDHPFLSDQELVIDRGEGVWIWTEQGKKLLDGFAGLAVVNVGHGRREIAEAIAEQTVRLAYYPTTRQFSNRPAADLAAKLASLTPGDLRYTMFAVSGSEANERSMQIARQYWLASGKSGKHKVISLQGGYHGATMGTFAVCGLPHLAQPYQPLEVPGFAKVAPPHPFRDLGTGTEAELIARRIGELREAILREGPDTVSAVIMEPVLSSGGFIMPPIGWLRAVRALCDELDVLMIADEVITGFGRTGRWFAVEHDQSRAGPHVGGQGHHVGLHPALGQHRARAARRRVLRHHHPGERPPQHLRRAPGGVRGRAGESEDHGAGPPGRERGEDGDAAPGGSSRRGGQAPHRGRGARAAA